jgi:hypothetical protein
MMRTIAIIAVAAALAGCGLDDKFKGASGGGDDMAVVGTDDIGESDVNDLSGIMPLDFSGQAPADLTQLPTDLSGPFTWTAASGLTGNFRAGFALARNNVWVVGDGNLVIHSPGDGTWSTPVDTGVTGGKYSVIWGDRATGDLWIAGYDASTSVIVHTKDGTHWNKETQSTTLGSAVLALWGSSASDVYASGNAANGLLVHTTGNGVWGTAIGLQPNPNPVHYFLGIGGSSSSNAFFVGGRDVYRWTGSGGYNLEYQNATTNIVNYAVYAVSATDIYMAASNGIYYSKGNGQWAAQTTAVTATSVWGSGPTDIYVAGGGPYHSIGDGNWTSINVQNMYPNAVFGYDADDVYFVGNNAISHGHR